MQVDIPSEPEDDEDDPDGRFAFKRKRGVKYMAVSWTSDLFPEIIWSRGFIKQVGDPFIQTLRGGGGVGGWGWEGGWPVSKIVGNLSNDEGDGNESV